VVEKRYRDGHIGETEYCESDVVHTYRVWLRYELFRGRLLIPIAPSAGLAQAARSLASVPGSPLRGTRPFFNSRL
jgi:hypothetical protein